MKIFIAIAVIFNIYGVLSEPHIFQKREYLQQLGDLHPRRHHEHHRHHHNDESLVLTTDDLADVLLSLPGSLGKEAYKTFLALGRFLPADTKAHKFFTSIPKAIRRKSNDEFTATPTMPSAPLSPNSMFMMQPAGYHMVPLPLHPMFSSSPLDYITRVPCRHTKVIRVPLHTFDVQISAITHKFNPSQSGFDESVDENDDEMDFSLKDLFDLISSDNKDDDQTSRDSGNGNLEGKKSSEEDAPEIKKSDNDDPDFKKNEASKTDEDLEGKKSSEEDALKIRKSDSDDPDFKKNDASKTDEVTSLINEDEPSSKPEEETPPTESTEEKKEVPEPSTDETLSKATEVEPSTEDKPASEIEETSLSAPSQQIEETAPVVKEEGLTAEAIESTQKEASQQNETPPQESAESLPAAADKPEKKKKKKASAKKDKKAAAKAEAEPALEAESETAAASPAEDDYLMEEVSKPIPTKKGKKKKRQL